MKTGSAGRKLIESFEGLILGAYDDFNDRIVQPGEAVKGTLTIGYGHTNAAGPPKVFAGQKVTKEQADAILASDLTSVELEVTHLVKVPLNQNQFDALVSFHFNTGALGKSSALRLLNVGEYAKAADALTMYNRGNGQVLQGLVRRRAAERTLFLTKVDTKTGPSTGGAIIAAGTATAAAVSYWPQHIIPIVIGIAVLGLVIGYVVHKINNKGKVNVSNVSEQNQSVV